MKLEIDDDMKLLLLLSFQFFAEKLEIEGTMFMGYFCREAWEDEHNGLFAFVCKAQGYFSPFVPTFDVALINWVKGRNFKWLNFAGAKKKD
jgi:hypothetical protein